MVKLAKDGGIGLGETRFVWPYRCETWRREELLVRADLKRKWEADELARRVDDREMSRKIGLQEQTGEEPGQIESGPGPAKVKSAGAREKKVGRLFGWRG